MSDNVGVDYYAVNDYFEWYGAGMADRPYHHGNLRAALLAEAERTLRDDGIERLSLRDLARQAGVSHAAPRRHFADRQALLDALSVAGFLRLSEELRAAIGDAGDNYEAQLRAAATAYVRFATRDAALLDLMFTAKRGEQSAALRDAFGSVYSAVDGMVRQGQAAGTLRPGDPDRLRLLLFAIMQGVAALVTSGAVDATRIDGLIADAVALFTNSSH